MATLIEGQRYGLSSHVNNSNAKTLIFVKLTDSALRAIEQFILNNKGNSANVKPSIQFNSHTSQGVIGLPIKSNNEYDERQRFGFTLSNIDSEGPQGNFECVRHAKNKSIESFGNMQYKMQIHASEDSYQTTKVKMAVVERESKKNCTKVIKASGPNVGRKVKVKRPVNFNSKMVQSSNHIKSVSPPALKLNGNHINVKNVNSGVANHNGKSPNLSSNISSNDHVKRLLRERVIHLLALHSYTKPELIVRLSKCDGIKVHDRKELSTMLNEINAVINEKDGAYHLTRELWNEVHTDWVHYNSDERECVKQRLAQMQQQNGVSPLSDRSSQSAFSPQYTNELNSLTQSPHSITNNNSNKRHIETVSTAMKRPKNCSQQLPLPLPLPAKSPNKLQTNGYDDLLNGWAHKPSPDTQLIHQNTTNGSSHSNVDVRTVDSALSNNNHSPDTNGLCLSNQPNQSQPLKRDNYLTNGNFESKVTNNGVNKQMYRYGKTNSHNNSIGLRSINSTPNSSPDSGTGSNDGSSSACSFKSSYSVSSDIPVDYLTKFVKIENEDQWSKYKSEFYREYEEYKHLHTYIENIACKFSELEIRLNTKIEGSEEWNKLLEQIVKEYEETTKNNAKFHDTRRRMIYLHDKLAHIKRLVVEYDRTHPRKVSRITHNGLNS